MTKISHVHLKRGAERKRERERGWIHVVVISISMLVKVCGKCC